MKTLVPLSALLLGTNQREQLQQGWSPQCFPNPAPEAQWGVLKTTAVQPGSFNSDENKELPPKFAPRPELEVREGDLLMTCAGPRARCGVATLVRTTRSRLMLSGKIYRFRTDNSLILPRYLELFLLSPQAQASIDQMKTGISDSGLNLTKGRLLDLEVPVVDLDHQRLIVDALEAQLTHIDAAAAYLDAAFKKEKSLHAVQLSSLANNDEPQAPLASIAFETRYGTSTKCTKDGPGMAVVRIPNLRDGTISLTDEKRAANPDVDLSGLTLDTGDLLLVRTNGSRDLIGRTAVVRANLQAAFASYLIRFRFDPELADPEWVHLMLSRPQARATLERLAASSAGQYNLGIKKLNAVRIPLPPVAEQRRRIQSYQDARSRASVATDAIIASRMRTISLRRMILSEAFSNKLTVTPFGADLPKEITNA